MKPDPESGVAGTAGSRSESSTGTMRLASWLRLTAGTLRSHPDLAFSLAVLLLLAALAVLGPLIWPL